MVEHAAHFQHSPFSKYYTSRSKAVSFSSDVFFYLGISVVVFVAVCGVWSFFSPTPLPNISPSDPIPIPIPTLRCDDVGSASDTSTTPGPNLRHEPGLENFYDDPKLSYTIDSPPIKNWDEKRKKWLRQHPSFLEGVQSRILMLTGSQAEACKNPMGDHLLLKLFKNKVDYCRRHGIDIFYNNVLFHPKMFSFWAKTSTVKAAMLAHPEAEWIWWVDSDAAITDMDFTLPLERYKDHNMVVHGWLEMIYGKQSWTGINAGVFLIRNCQWAMDLMDVWASMGPQSREYEKWGRILSSTFKDKIFPQSDDQSGLAYLILREKEKWGNKIYVEGEYYFEGYWVEIVGNFDNITSRYAEIEKNVAGLRRRHAEKVSESYGKVWEEQLKEAGNGRGSWRRPFITHFTGCQPCSGDHNHIYSGKTCLDAMHKALLFADNQVLRNYGFVHNQRHPSTVKPLPFDYPA